MVRNQADAEDGLAHRDENHVVRERQESAVTPAGKTGIGVAPLRVQDIFEQSPGVNFQKA
jgi:hypothetical protein